MYDMPPDIRPACVQLVSGQAVGTLFDLEESRYMQERMEAEAQHQGTQS